MTSTPGQPDAVSAADRLTGALDGMAGQLKTVSDRLAAAEDIAQRNRRFIIGLVISFCLDLLITAGFGYNTIRVDDTQNASHASEISACQQANVNRAEDIAIWNRFLGDLAPVAARTPKVQAELAGINKLIAVKDTPRDCNALYAK